jgi:rubredoxin
VAENIVCPECGGQMQEGFMADQIQGADYFLRLFWVEGQPQKSGFKAVMKPLKREKYFITAYRCQKCGFLKFYADPNQPFVV